MAFLSHFSFKEEKSTDRTYQASLVIQSYLELSGGFVRNLSNSRKLKGKLLGVNNSVGVFIVEINPGGFLIRQQSRASSLQRCT